MYLSLLSLIEKIKDLVIAKSTFTGLKPKVRRMSEEVIEKMFYKGYPIIITQAYRSSSEQDYLYAQGRTRSGPIITNARGGQSYHNYGVAVDFAFLVDGRPSWDNSHPWHILGEVIKEVGFEWGGDWKKFTDRPHAQLTFDYHWSHFQKGLVDYRKYL